MDDIKIATEYATKFPKSSFIYGAKVTKAPHQGPDDKHLARRKQQILLQQQIKQVELEIKMRKRAIA